MVDSAKLVLYSARAYTATGSRAIGIDGVPVVRACQFAWDYAHKDDYRVIIQPMTEAFPSFIEPA